MPAAYRHGNTSIDFADRGRRGLRSEQRGQAATVRARLLSWRLVTALQQAVGPTARDRASIEEFGSAAFRDFARSAIEAEGEYRQAQDGLPTAVRQ